MKYPEKPTWGSVAKNDEVDPRPTILTDPSLVMQVDPRAVM
jgi:hypothetical protein